MSFSKNIPVTSYFPKTVRGGHRRVYRRAATCSIKQATTHQTRPINSEEKKALKVFMHRRCCCFSCPRKPTRPRPDSSARLPAAKLHFPHLFPPPAPSPDERPPTLPTFPKGAPLRNTRHLRTQTCGWPAGSTNVQGMKL